MRRHLINFETFHFQLQSDSRVSFVCLFVRLSVIRVHQESSSVIKCHQVSSSVIKCVIKYHQVSSSVSASVINSHQVSTCIMREHASTNVIKLHHASSSVINCHHQAAKDLKNLMYYKSNLITWRNKIPNGHRYQVSCYWKLFLNITLKIQLLLSIFTVWLPCKMQIYRMFKMTFCPSVISEASNGSVHHTNAKVGLL